MIFSSPGPVPPATHSGSLAKIDLFGKTVGTSTAPVGLGGVVFQRTGHDDLVRLTAQVDKPLGIFVGLRQHQRDLAEHRFCNDRESSDTSG